MEELFNAKKKKNLKKGGKGRRREYSTYDIGHLLRISISMIISKCNSNHLFPRSLQKTGFHLVCTYKYFPLYLVDWSSLK